MALDARLCKSVDALVAQQSVTQELAAEVRDETKCKEVKKKH